MNSGYQEQLGEVLAQLAERQATLQAARESLEARRVTVTSKDHLVSATVNARGDLSELKFHTTKYRTMAPAQLASVLTQVVTEARAEMAGIVAETFQPLAPQQINLRETMSGNSSLNSVLEELTAGLQAARDAGRTNSHD